MYISVELRGHAKFILYGPAQKGIDGAHTFLSCIEAGHKYFFLPCKVWHTPDECTIASCGSTESSSVPESSSDEGVQLTTSERPGRDLFSLGEVQDTQGSQCQTSRTFQRFLLAEQCKRYPR